jgi:hypothetical protein
MTLSPHQRINVAMALGIKLRGKMTYECTVTPFSARPEPMVRLSFTVEADSPTHAASEAAQQCAAHIAGTPGFVAPQNDGTFIATIGRQHPSETGITTHGFSVRIIVAPAGPK